MSEYHIGGIPVVDAHNCLVGIVTNRDLRFERNLDKLIDDVMTSENLVTTIHKPTLLQLHKSYKRTKLKNFPL